jgi:hypothetical protein
MSRPALDNSRIDLLSLSPIINGLSDHSAEILKIKNKNATANQINRQ